ncbi:hypothetical protein V8G54_025232 [Vigna mungo]|uniref:Sec23/Sec24 trunk domain-containing protein n=1 Tax=Vigna mungo TaxID=3915 RepID=A0AAQ3RU59_VIGMU
MSSFVDLELPTPLAPGSLFGLATFSHKLGLYDVQGPIPVVKNVFIPPDADGTLPIELEDVMPLLQFLAPVDTCKDRIASALETLRPTTSWERTTAAGQGLDGVLIGGRGFGMAMEALCNYLGSEYGNTFALARVFAFLSGPPDYGAGQLDTRRYGEQYASKGEDADRALLPEQTPFYKDLAAVAVQAGVCVDIFAVTNEYTDLASLKFLSIESGGSLFLYTSTEDSTLPQDISTVILASLEEGVREGRILLQEWLVILTAQYNDAYKLIQYSNGSSLRSQIDVALSQCPQLQPLPRLIFALLRNPLLRFHEEGHVGTQFSSSCCVSCVDIICYSR